MRLAKSSKSWSRQDQVIGVSSAEDLHTLRDYFLTSASLPLPSKPSKTSEPSKSASLPLRLRMSPSKSATGGAARATVARERSGRRDIALDTVTLKRRQCAYIGTQAPVNV